MSDSSAPCELNRATPEEAPTDGEAPPSTLKPPQVLCHQGAQDILGPDISKWLNSQGVRAELRLVDEEGNVVPAQRERSLRQSARSFHERATTTRDLSTVGSLTASLTHEVRNILSGVLGLSQLKARAGAEAQSFETIAVEAARGTELLANFLSVARSSEAKPQLTTIADILEPVGLLTLADARRQSAKIHFLGIENPQPFVTDSGKAKQVLLNLVLNALQSTGKRGTLRVDGQLVESSVVFTVDDDGPGVPEEQREAIFEAFYSTRTERGGTGLGLSKAKSLVQAIGGELTVESSSLGGARFVMRLPAQAPLTKKEAGQ